MRCLFLLPFLILLNMIAVTPARAQTFGPAVPVDTTTPGIIYQWMSDIAVDREGNVGVVWVNQTVDNDIVMFAKSTDGGQTWQKTVVEDSSFWGSHNTRFNPALVFDMQNNPWVVWQCVQYIYFWTIRVARSLDGGESFGDPFFRQDAFETDVRSITIDEDSNVYIPWRLGGLKCVTFLKGNPENWISAQINPDTLQPNSFPDFRAKGSDTLFCAWLDIKDWPRSILYFSRSGDHGQTLSNPVLISSSGGQGTYGQQSASISVDTQGVIYVTWADDRTGDYDIYLCKSYNNGNNFTESERINDRVEGAQHRAENTYNQLSGLCVAWVEGDNIHNNDIYFTRSTDGGETFSAGILIGGEQHQPLYQTLWGIATDDSGNVYVAFTDRRLGRHHLFVTKGTFESTDVTEQASNLALPENAILQQNYPNPFNAQTTIELSVPTESFLTLNIYNILGEKVRTLIKTSVAQGQHQVVWDGKNARGNLVSSGVYFCKLETQNASAVKKLLLLR